MKGWLSWKTTSSSLPKNRISKSWTKSAKHSINKPKSWLPSSKRDGTLKFCKLRLRMRLRSKRSSNARSRSTSCINRRTRRRPRSSLESQEPTWTCAASKKSRASRNDMRRPGELRPPLINYTKKRLKRGTRQSLERSQISKLICE